jgi:hypothetical protein
MREKLFGNRGNAKVDVLNQVDLAMVVDTTGSMGSFISTARQHMIAMLEALMRDTALPIDMRVGLVEYRDHPPEEDTFVFRIHEFTPEMGLAQRIIERLEPSGGGDAPEAVFDGLRGACEELDWRPYARRLAILVGDAPPHGTGADGDSFASGCPCGLTLHDTTAIVEAKGILLYALGLTGYVTESFGELAQLTGGEFFSTDQGSQAIETLKDLLADEFSDLDFDRKVMDFWTTEPNSSVDDICKALESTRGRVSASLSRLGRRGLC